MQSTRRYSSFGRLAGFLAVAGALAVGDIARAEGEARPTVDFNRQVLPILSENCFACHGPDAKARKAGLRLDTQEGALGKLKGGGSAIVPGKSAQSAVVERILSTEPTELMPPAKSGKKLTPQQIQILKRWIDEGAPMSRHWSLVGPVKVAPPAVSDRTWAQNPVDRFILARLEKEGLRPTVEADKEKLLRRVTLDLTGLPPTLAELDAFLSDPSARAYEEAVDRLLRSPRYGEHMARYWLDAARYGDTHGLHLDNFREMWPFRDWVVSAFNRNLPYDRFVIEQLAGDMLPGATIDQIVASGFNRCHVTTSEGGSIEEEVYVRNVVDRVDTTSTVMMGLSVGCARCHDHKFDPISSKDYYQIFAIFNSLDDKPLDGNAARHAPILRLESKEQAARLGKLTQQVADMRKKIADELAKVSYDDPADAKPAGPTDSKKTHGEGESLAAWLKKHEAAGGYDLPQAIRALVRVEPGKRSTEQKKQLRDYYLERVYAKVRPTFDPLVKALDQAEKDRDQLDQLIPATLISKEQEKPRPAFMLKRGEYDQRGEPVGRGTPASLPPLPVSAPKNRLTFAQWLVAPEHPLTARVAVNRFWQHCFGTGLVRTAEDFGAQGEQPSHPELLDWLAIQFQEDGWDVKRMMKRIVTSATYRQSSRVTPDRLAKDPANRLLSRGPRFRIDAEMLRDQALAVSGLLVDKVGGPGVKPPQPAGLWEAVGYVTSNTRNFVADTGRDKVHRRSLYTFWKRTAPPPQMNSFDAPSREACTIRRERTNTPLQALLLLNEEQYIEAARALAQRTMKEGGKSVEDRLAYLFRLAAARRPDDKEKAELAAAYRDHLDTYSRDEKAAKELIGVGESKPDASVNPSELAAWTMVANLVLNLDEVLNKG